MKRIKKIKGVALYDIIRSRENVELAVRNACHDHHRDPIVQKIKIDPEPYIEGALQILNDRTFHYSKFKHRTIWERGKKRELCYTRTFPDRILQHAVMQVVSPILLGTCTRDTYAAREGMGIHHGSMQVRKAMKADPHGTRYCLKMDVRHYFDSIDRKILFEKVKRKIKCGRTLDILEEMIFGCPGEMGLPIGLYSSQIFSTFYLSDLDHYVKERLGATYYYRYMDDLVLLFGSKHYLRVARTFIERRLSSMALTLKGNWQIFPVNSRGVDFLGFVMRHRGTRLRKRVKIALIRSTNVIVNSIRHGETVTPRMLASMRSYIGMAGWCDTKRLIERHYGRAVRAMEFGPEAI